MKTHQVVVFLCILSMAFKANSQKMDFIPNETIPFGRFNPAAPKEVRDYEEMIGICDCKSLARRSDGTWPDSVNMVWKFEYIFNGRAVQDRTFREDGFNATSIRQYDPDSSRWVVSYFSSNSANPSAPVWTGNRDKEQMILYKEQTAPNGMKGYYRITFYEITHRGFRWKGEWVSENESVVFPNWYIDCKKRL